MQQQRKAYLLALAAIFFWSTIATAFKLGLEVLDVFQLIAASSLVSLLFFTIWMTVSRKWSLLKSDGVKGVLNSALLGFLNPFLYYVVLIHAYDMISAQEAMTLNYVWPIVLSLLSIPLLKQKMNPKALLAMLISFAGIIMIASRGDLMSLKLTDLKGDFLALSSSIAWALYWLLNVRDKREVAPKMFLNFAFGSLYAVIALLIFSDFQIESARSLLPALYIGVFEMGLTFAIWLAAVGLSKKTYLVAQLIFLSPFLGMIWIDRVLGEKILWTTVMGFGLIVAGILIQQYFERRSKVSEAENK